MADTPGSRNPWRFAFTILGVAALAWLVMFFTWTTLPPGERTPPPPSDRPTLPVVADIGGDFSLPSTLDKELALADFKGQVVFLNFGFTHCPDICPTVLSRLAGAMTELEAEGVAVQGLFVTFDPARDDLARLRDYLGFFHPQLVGLRGSEEQTRDLARQYRVIYLRQDTESAAGYVFSHTDFIYVLDRQGRVRLLVGSKDPAEALVAAARRLNKE